MSERPEVLLGLEGVEPYLYHPRAFEHPGPIITLGAIGWNFARPFVGKKTVIGVDSCPVVREFKGCTLIRRAVAPFDGVVQIKGGIPGIREGGQGFAVLEAAPASSYWAQTIRLSTLRDTYGPDFAALKINIEGAELLSLIMLREPIADQITMSFHGAVYRRSARDAVMAHMDSWYDHAQISTKNDWWFFLRRPEAEWTNGR